MSILPQTIVALLSLASILLCDLASGLSLTVSSNEGNASSPLLYGFMFEVFGWATMTCQLLTTHKDINHSGDGGIHAQLLRNNGFQGENATLTAYNAVGGTTLAVDFDNPLSQAIQRSLRVSVAEGTTGQVGFSNEGYWGIQVNQARCFSR